MAPEAAKGVSIRAPVNETQATVLTLEAQAFVAALHRCFNPRRAELLRARAATQAALDAGQLPNFLPETAAVRADPAWRGAPPAPGLADRRVEITGPVDRKMVINALNSGATQFMAEVEGVRAAAGGAPGIPYDSVICLTPAGRPELLAARRAWLAGQRRGARALAAPRRRGASLTWRRAVAARARGRTRLGGGPGARLGLS